VFLRVLGQEDQPHVVDIQRPQDEAAQDWRVATSLPELKAKRYGFGTYIAANYDELIDHPVEQGDFALATFKAHGIPHDIVITGKVPNLDLARLSADLKKSAKPRSPSSSRRPKSADGPLRVHDHGGGRRLRRPGTPRLDRADLRPCRPADHREQGQGISDGYLQYLGLCSHEYFHTWNVKRIKPAVFAPYNLQVENYSPLLWLFEGFTSYYDDLMLVRAGIIGEPAYFKLLGKTVNSVLRGSRPHQAKRGRFEFRRLG
jgi:predicted metalloprotease with PDZ domain